MDQLEQVHRSATKMISRLYSSRTRRRQIQTRYKNFLMMRVVKLWNRLLWEVADASSWEKFKVGCDGALNNLTKAEDVPAHCGGFGTRCKPFYYSIKQ